MNALAPITPTKEAFAAALVGRADNDPFAAALDVFGADTAGALAASREWPTDPDVLAYIDGLSDVEIDEAGIPTDNDLVREAWRRVRMTHDHEIAFKGIETIRKIRDKGGEGTGGNTYVDNRKVMVVQNYGSDDEWEAAAREQQIRLVNDST